MDTSSPLNFHEFEVLEPPYQDMWNFYKDVKKLLSTRTSEDECIAVLQSQPVSESARLAIGLTFGFLSGETWLKILIFTSRDQCQQACNVLEKCLPRLKTYDRGLNFLLELYPMRLPAYPKLLLAFVRTVDTSKYLYMLMDWICEQPTALPSLVFYRVLRLASLHANNDPLLYQDDVIILNEIWRRRKSECLAIGRDLVRVLASMMTYLGLESIWNELTTPTREGVPMYLCVLSTPTKPQYHCMLLTPTVEERVGYLIDKCNPVNFARYMKWLIDGMPELVYPDFLRFIQTRVGNPEPVTQKHVLATWLLNTVTINYPIRAWLKQALIFDVLFLNPQEGVQGVEPFMSCIKYSLNKAPQLTEEIIEFLMISSERFDPGSKHVTTRNIKEAFHLADLHSILQTESLLIADKLAYDVRQRLAELLQMSIPAGASHLDAKQIQESVTNNQGAGEKFSELGKAFAQEPSLSNLTGLLKFCLVDEELTDFVLKRLTNELLEPLSPMLNDSSLLNQIFTAAGTDANIKNLVKSLKAQEPGIGIRILIFSLRTGNNLYQSLDQKEELERELQVGVNDVSLQTLHWIYPLLFKAFPTFITSGIVRLFLQIVSSELIIATEFDLMMGKYEIFRDKVVEMIEASVAFSSTEQLYMWKLLLAEIKPDRVGEVIQGVQKIISYGNQWEGISGMIECLSRNRGSITPEQVTMLLQFPAKHFASAVHIALIAVKPVSVQEAVRCMLQKPNQGAYNILRHVKYWVEQKSKLGELVCDEVLINSIKNLPAEIGAEFAILVPAQ